MKLNLKTIYNIFINIFTQNANNRTAINTKNNNEPVFRISDQVIKHNLITEAILKAPFNSNGYADINNILTYCMAHDRKYDTKWSDALMTGNPFINIYNIDKNKEGFNLVTLDKATEIFFESGNVFDDERFHKLTEFDNLMKKTFYNKH